MILSASRRTDIPCYYSEWFMNRIKAGYVLSRNPMNHSQISKIPISTDVVDCIVFWTKDPLNMMDKLETLDNLGYKYYFQFTLTPYDKSYEKNLRSKADIEDTFTKLSNIIGKNRVLWRYDPIILNNNLNIEYHKKHFTRMCERLYSYTNSVTISYVDIYPKLKTHMLREIAEYEIAELSSFIGEQCKIFGITAKACSENPDLSSYGISKASCIDKELIECICSEQLNIKADKNQRHSCGCCQSIDIGIYNTCKNGCIYCYANYSDSSVTKNFNSHNPLGDLLIGELLSGERLTNRKVASNKIV